MVSHQTTADGTSFPEARTRRSVTCKWRFRKTLTYLLTYLLPLPLPLPPPPLLLLLYYYYYYTTTTTTTTAAAAAAAAATTTTSSNYSGWHDQKLIIMDAFFELCTEMFVINFL